VLSLIQGAIPQRCLSLQALGFAISHPTNIALGSRSPTDDESSVDRPAFGIQKSHLEASEYRSRGDSTATTYWRATRRSSRTQNRLMASGRVIKQQKFWNSKWPIHY